MTLWARMSGIDLSGLIVNCDGNLGTRTEERVGISHPFTVMSVGINDEDFRQERKCRTRPKPDFIFFRHDKTLFEALQIELW